ncbi:MAG: adenylyl-sulfate kinase [Flavitalea sp.]
MKPATIKNNRMIIQFCGLSGSGKSTLAIEVKKHFDNQNVNIEIIDGDEYRKFLCRDLGFSKEDRHTNIRRLAFVAGKLAQYHVIPIICAINPYKDIREEVSASYQQVKTIYIKCSLDELIRRDTKGMYSKALLPENDANRISNLSGVNDPFEIPSVPDLVVETDKESVSESCDKIIRFINENK